LQLLPPHAGLQIVVAQPGSQTQKPAQQSPVMGLQKEQFPITTSSLSPAPPSDSGKIANVSAGPSSGRIMLTPPS